MRVFERIAEWREFRNSLRDVSIGFVPTMGTLHDGHMSLVRRSMSDNEVTVVSLFVNPTQFDRPEDLRDYPRQTETDIELLERAGVDAVLLPGEGEIYLDGANYRVSEHELSGRFCGAYRPGHFDGVLNVVMRLFNIVRPARAYFGEKDWQQLCLVRGMVEAFFMDIEVVACPVVREADGLAMSSRNRRLSREERALAPAFYAELAAAGLPGEIRQRLEALGFSVDYVDDFGTRRLAGASLGKTRLIDNVELR